MVAEMVAHEFDPLVEYYGNWTTELAEHYVPVPWVPPGTSYECVDGYLIMSPYEGTGNAYATAELWAQMRDPARANDHRAYMTVNLKFNDDTWIQPDLTVLKASVKQQTWVSASDALIVGECVSPSSRRRDRIDKPALCVAAGVPFYLRVEVNKSDVLVVLSRLRGNLYKPIATAMNGERFVTDEPFPLDFDPVVLLED